MTVETLSALMIGTGLGAAAGLLLARARPCGSEHCNIKGNMIAFMIAGAVFGAAVAMYVVSQR